MKIFNGLSIVFLTFVTLLRPVNSTAGEVTDQLSRTVNELVTILVNTPVAELRAHGLPEKALKLVYDRFDFSELTKRSLGHHWTALNAAEQREFVNALTQKLLVAYGRTVRASGDEKVEFKGEVVDGNFAKVETKIISSSGEFPIDYRLHMLNGQWKVYDMVIENVSIVNNYRAQFERVIARSSIKELLEIIKHQES
jgi:phospholipid transport system substrate-binding protein